MVLNDLYKRRFDRVSSVKYVVVGICCRLEPFFVKTF
jgi:hypothetical protein